MKIKFIVIAAFVAFTSNTPAANYISLASGIQLYDVEVVVFSRQNQTPHSSQFNNREEVDLIEVNAMFPAETDTELLIDEQTVNTSDEQWQVPIEGEKHSNAKALAWFALDQPAENNPVYKKLNKHPNMQALFYQQWRQPATPYSNPGFIKISNWSVDKLNDSKIDQPSSTIVGDLYQTESDEELEFQVKPNYTVRGKVAFSKRRFQHGHVDVNLYRESQDGETLVYRITQETQIDLDQWQYFDHPQFGVMLRVKAAQFE